MSLYSDHLPRAAPVTLGPCLLPAVPPSPQPPSDLCTALLFSASVSQGCYKCPAEHGNRWTSPLGLSRSSLGEKHKTWRAGPHQDSLPHVCPPTYFCLPSWEPMTPAESKAGPPATRPEPSSPRLPTQAGALLHLASQSLPSRSSFPTTYKRAQVSPFSNPEGTRGAFSGSSVALGVHVSSLTRRTALLSPLPHFLADLQN